MHTSFVDFEDSDTWYFFYDLGSTGTARARATTRGDQGFGAGKLDGPGGRIGRVGPGDPHLGLLQP